MTDQSVGQSVGQAVSRLTALEVRNLTKPGRYGDGDGLYLVIRPHGAKEWCLRYQLRGRRRDMSLGGLTPTNGLATARQAAQQARDAVSRGVDPIDARKRPTGVPTFAEHAVKLVATLAPSWRGKKTEGNWSRSLQTHAAKLGPKLVDQIGTEDVLGVVKLYWTTQPESGGKLRERIERVLDSARAEGLIQGPWENPARWKGHLAHMLPKQKKLSRGHHPAMPYGQCPAFVALIATKASMGARALEFAILTAAREEMVCGATWAEVHGDVWTIPAGRMKLEVAHRVPLSPAAVAVLDRVGLAGRPGRALIFPGRRGKQMSSTTMDRVLIRLKLGYTPHGFRSSFRDWAGDCTEHPREIAEAALAHTIGNAVEQSYRRGDALAKRRLLMDDWAAYLAAAPPAPAAEAPE